MSSVPFRVVGLIENYDRGIKENHSSQYKKNQLRIEFIDPFFEEIG